MITAVQPLTDVQTWLRGDALEILLIVSGAILAARAVGWVGELTTGRIDANALESDALVRSEAAKHRHALTQVVSWTIVVAIYVVAGILVAQRLGVPMGGLVAPAAVVGVALGFGAQRLVQDVLSGFFVNTERQYGYGDVVRLSVVGIGAPVHGTVE
ncbi:MAG: moderate conductance mechanosensitive channel, partial [Actinomycetota bacterium]|nr:moderate conductance mechanosensitive channel [Actinomycetota bacterium]